MKTRKLGPFDVSAIGFGCMSLSHAYGGRPEQAAAEAILHKALDLGHTLIDTASVYGLGHNETLVGETLKARRGEFVLASKAGLWIGPDGKRQIDGRPETIRKTLDDSLRRLQVEVLDLYYIHRLDFSTPIEDTVGELARAVAAGKIRAIGLSEMSADTLRRAHAVHPVTAMQTEYSLWTRQAEIAVLQACKDLGVAFVAFSPLARGFLTGRLRDVEALEPKDIRRFMPRFQGENFAANLALLAPFGEVAQEIGCTPGQLALAWTLAKGDHIIPIPGTGKLDHLVENAGGAAIDLTADQVARLDAIINQATVHGPRYNAANQADIDTEDFAA